MPAQLDQPTWDFLVQCLRSRWEPAALDAARSEATRPELDWPGLLEHVGPVGVGPLLYDAVRGRDLVPAPVEEALLWIYQQTAIQNAYVGMGLAEALDSLAAAGLPVIVLKGAALGEELYGNAALRPMTDVDLLFRADDVLAAVAQLEALGYGRVHDEPHPGLTLAYENEITLRRPGVVPVTLEIHWYLLDAPYYQERLATDWFWQTARELTLAGRPAQVLSPEANLLYLSAHLVLHHKGVGLRWFYDIATLVALSGALIDWDMLLEKAGAFHLVTPVQRVLAELAGEWAVPIPEAQLAEALALPVSPVEQRVVSWLTAPERPVAQRFWADLAGLPGWRARVPFALAHLFPSRNYMRQRYALDSDWLVPLAYPYRWVLGLRELLTSQAQSSKPPSS